MSYGLNLPPDMPFAKQMKLSIIYGLAWGLGMGVAMSLIVIILGWLHWLPKL